MLISKLLLASVLYWQPYILIVNRHKNSIILCINLIIITLFISFQQNKDEDRSQIIPSAASFEAPRERIDDAKPAMSGVKTFLYMMAIAIVIIVLVVLGIMYYQKRQEQTRKRLY